MFCSKCGVQFEQETNFCPNCGVNLKSDTQSKAKKQISINKKTLFLIVAAVAIGLVFLIAGNIGVNSSPEKVAIAAVESEYEIDIDKMIKVFPEFTLRELADDYGLSFNASRNDIANEIKKDYRYVSPEEVHIIEAEVIEEYSLEEFLRYDDFYNDYMTDTDFEGISDIAVVDVYFTVDGDEERVQVDCIKIKGKWYLMRD